MKKIQKLVTLSRRDGQYLNFFYTPGSIDSLERFLSNGWLVKEMELNKEAQTGWVLLEKEQEEK